MASASENQKFVINPLIVALDVDRREECLSLVEKLGSRAGAFKLGPRLVVRYGADLVREIARSAPVFVDNKYLDIPSTMEGAIRATFDSGASLATIHAWAGPEALSRLAKIERELNSERPFRILAVTLLTSFSSETLPPGMRDREIATQIDELADMTIESGLSGLVCSPHEAERIRRRHPSSFLVVPGVRLPTDASGDQKRVETPEFTIRAGASAIVVGRPIYEAKDPIAAADAVLASIARGSSRK